MHNCPVGQVRDVSPSARAPQPKTAQTTWLVQHSQDVIGTRSRTEQQQQPSAPQIGDVGNLLRERPVLRRDLLKFLLQELCAS